MLSIREYIHSPEPNKKMLQKYRVAKHVVSIFPFTFVRGHKILLA